MNGFLQFLRFELSPFPGRANVVLRCLLTSAVVIVTSMTFEIPFLALSLLVVFYVTQANVVITRMAGIVFLLGVSLAIGIALVLLKITYDFPLLRIVVASGLFFASVYAMRVLKVGMVFFIVAVVIIYVQSFVDMTSIAELFVRLIMWVWVSVNYSIALTLLVNTVFLPAEPADQLAAELHRQMAAVGDALDASTGVERAFTPITLFDVQRGTLTLHKLLKFAAMRETGRPSSASRQLAHVVTVSRLYRAASGLSMPVSAEEFPSIMGLRIECAAFDTAIAKGLTYCAQMPSHLAFDASVREMQSALQAFSSMENRLGPTQTLKAKTSDSILVSDAFTNPAYVRFSLKTLLAVLGCYVFYNAVQWAGIHTIMLTCVVIALPSVGASNQKAILRAAGALIGSALALFVVVFVMPHLDDIVGLLSISLPVVALGAWVAAGSERIGYAGIQIVFTFSLALLESFGPTSDLNELRDRLVGILLGIGVSTFVQMAIWPERESDEIRHRLADALASIAASIRGSSQAHLQAASWAKLGDCENMLARVVLEPAWEEGEHERLMEWTQAVLAQSREILSASYDMDNEVSCLDSEFESEARNEALALKSRAATQIEGYVRDILFEPFTARRLSPLSLQVLAMHAPASRPALLTAARAFVWQVAGLPVWRMDDPSPENIRESAEHD
jgi:multidrug resistance protein MdtO